MRLQSAKTPKKLLGYFLPLLFVFFVCFVGTSLAQTEKQLQFYKERIQFGEIEVKRNALFDLRNFESERASRIAIPALKDSSEIVRATATHSVVFLPAEQAVRILTPLLKEKSEYVRRETAYALGEIASPIAIPILSNLLETDRKRVVKTASAVSLGRIGDVSAVSVLTLVLQKKRKKKNRFLRRASARAIGQIAQFIQTGSEQETTPEDFLPNKYHPLKKVRFRKLSKTFPVFMNASDTLISMLQDSKEHNDTKREAAFALGEIGSQKAASVLQKYKSSPDYYLAEISKQALRKILR